MFAFFAPQFLLAYVIFSLLVGYLGRHKYLGFWGYVFMSLLITPVAMGLMLFVTRDQPRR